jgi:hypothetical protein
MSAGFLTIKKPVDQLVADIGVPGNGLKVIPDAFVELLFCMVCIVGALLCNNIQLFGQIYILKTLTHQFKQFWTIVLISIPESSRRL